MSVNQELRQKTVLDKKIKKMKEENTKKIQKKEEKLKIKELKAKQKIEKQMQNKEEKLKIKELKAKQKIEKQIQKEKLFHEKFNLTKFNNMNLKELRKCYHEINRNKHYIQKKETTKQFHQQKKLLLIELKKLIDSKLEKH